METHRIWKSVLLRQELTAKEIKAFLFHLHLWRENIQKKHFENSYTRWSAFFFLISTLHRLTFFRRWEQHRPRTLYRISALWRSCVLTPARESCFGTAYAAMNSLLHPHNALLTDSCSVSRPGWFRPLMCRPRPCRPLMRRCAKAKVPVGDPRYLPPKARRKHLDCAWCWCQQPWIHNLSGTTEVLCAWGANDRSWRNPQKKTTAKYDILIGGRTARYGGCTKRRSTNGAESLLSPNYTRPTTRGEGNQCIASVVWSSPREVVRTTSSRRNAWELK